MTPSPAVRRGPRWERPAREDRLPEPATRGNCLSRPDARRSVPAPGRQRVGGRLRCFEAPWGGAPGMPRTDSRPPLGDGRDPEISKTSCLPNRRAKNSQLTSICVSAGCACSRTSVICTSSVNRQFTFCPFSFFSSWVHVHPFWDVATTLCVQVAFPTGSL